MVEVDDDGLWCGPPPPPDPDIVVGDLSCQGILALTLRDALLELQTTPSDQDLDCGGNGSSEPEPLDGPLSNEAVDRIMEACGQALVRVQQEQSIPETTGQSPNGTDNTRFPNAGEQPEPQSAAIITTTALAHPPAAILRGRIQYYNRVGSKWRLVVHDAELQPRQPLHVQRRKRERSSLWTTTTTAAPDAALKIPRLEILAYNDIE
jgi:hypothetical protein